MQPKFHYAMPLFLKGVIAGLFCVHHMTWEVVTQKRPAMVPCRKSGIAFLGLKGIIAGPFSVHDMTWEGG